MATFLEGEVYAVSGNDKVGMVVSVKVGLSPKVIRFPTEDAWTAGQKVWVTVIRATPVKREELVTVEGTID